MIAYAEGMDTPNVVVMQSSCLPYSWEHRRMVSILTAVHLRAREITRRQARLKTRCRCKISETVRHELGNLMCLPIACIPWAPSDMPWRVRQVGDGIGFIGHAVAHGLDRTHPILYTIAREDGVAKLIATDLNLYQRRLRCARVCMVLLSRATKHFLPHRDMRRLLAGLVWDTRKEQLWEVAVAECTGKKQKGGLNP